LALYLPRRYGGDHVHAAVDLRGVSARDNPVNLFTAAVLGRVNASGTY
jgi:hypothetical protein